jgi:hypothetical protein
MNPRKAQNFCPKCGSAVFKTDIMCVTCNEKLAPAGKDWLTTLLLWFFVGYFGVHRFYTGNILVGILQLITFCGCGIWWIIDLILIVNNSYRDGEGRPLDRSGY